MMKQGIRPDLIMYNALINGLCKIRNLKKVRKVVNEISEIGLKFIKIMFTILIERYCKDGDIKFVLEIKKKMIIEREKEKEKEKEKEEKEIEGYLSYFMVHYGFMCQRFN
ncbi:hypothetical protein AHAS_Ahas16G0245300 [Arachis hypogaea]